MGEQRIRKTDTEEQRHFMRRLLDDLRALETMLDEGRIESGVARIGAEQELFLIDRDGRPAPLALAMLEAVDDPHFTTELARFNLEFNVDPLDLAPHCLSQLEGQIDGLVKKARSAADTLGAEVLLTGILPTLVKSDLTLDNMTPVPRYFTLAEAFQNLRGSAFEFNIEGIDELTLTHDSVMVESCNTSFQVHFQVDPERFAPLYNIAQAVAAPVLAAAANSPLLFGRRLWRETRIALFQQAVDTRGTKLTLRQLQPRVSFGEEWLKESVLEIFRKDIARFRVLLSSDVGEDPFAELAAGRAPSLAALRLHNGTIYRWNRPCYGIGQGRPHLRIENRILPAGPTVVDEVANAAYWFGLIRGLSDEVGDITRHMDFDIAKENFFAAARQGLDAHLTWLDGRIVPATELATGQLLPLARRGLDALGIASEDSDRYLGVVEERVRRGRTGARWMLLSLAGMKQEGAQGERMASLTQGLLVRQKGGAPVSGWDLAELRENEAWKGHYTEVQHLMSTDLFTVNEDEVVDLVACLMDWQHIRHVPVEDDQHRLVGLMSHRSLLRLMTHGGERRAESIAVRDLMQKEVITISPQASTLEALELMKQHRIGCLPVVENERLVGIITERDFLKIAGKLLEEFLQR
ncbi:MAG: CBS domain-containing protein [Acidobacteria bacterium]|nr:CBS domain-containing protein [Acidobacteriota bacterium]